VTPPLAFGRETPPPADVLAQVRAPFEAFATRYHGQWVEPAVLQPLGLLLDLTGEALRAKLILVGGVGEDQAMRPDFTIPVTRAHIVSGAAKGRYLYAGDAYRTPEPGRPAEFAQVGLELLGPSDDAAGEDALVAGLAYSAVQAGGRGDLALRFGDVALFHAFLAAIGLPEATAARLVRALPNPRLLARELDRAVQPRARQEGGRLSNGYLAATLADLPEGEAAGMLEELWRLAGIQPVGGRTPAEIVHRLALRAEAEQNPPLSPAESDLIRRYLQISAPIHQALSEVDGLAAEAKGDLSRPLEIWMQRLKTLALAGVATDLPTLATGFARPFGYYDGVLFEVTSPSLAGDEPIAGGGRYDGLPERLGGVRGAVGCMVRPALAWTGFGSGS
jgi:ATP phosphoribosyltransferase regulatory subunit